MQIPTYVNIHVYWKICVHTSVHLSGPNLNELGFLDLG
jgi:hypothetical protein